MKKNKKWYSILLSITMVWFMMLLVSWVFLLVLKESKDTKRMEFYLKSFAWAEWSVEMALLKSKKFDYSLSETLNKKSHLWKTLCVNWENCWPKDVSISYDIDSTSKEISKKELEWFTFFILPLFYYDENWNLQNTSNFSLSGLNQDVTWNIIGEENGISWLGNISDTTKGNFKTFEGGKVSFEELTIQKYLQNNIGKNYLILHNTGKNTLYFSMNVKTSWDFFTKDITSIIGTGEIGWFKQNLRVNINSWEYLSILKYAIFDMGN